MPKWFASAMLCLLLLLSVGTTQCELRCAVAALPAVPMAPSAMSHDAMNMSAGMEHCEGMSEASSLPNADAGCGQMHCRHQVLPSSSDFRAVTDEAGLQAAVLLPVSDYAVMPLDARRLEADNVPLPDPLSPLEQTSMLRV